MLGGLYGDLPPPTSASSDDDRPSASVWSKMAPPTLRKPSATFAPPTSLLRNPRPKATTTTTVQQQPPLTTTSFHPAALVAVQSTVLEEYDPGRPNDYDDYREERLRRAKDAEVRKELDRRRRDDEERDQREAEARLRDADQNRASAALNISGEEAWKRRAAMSGRGSAQRAAEPSSPPQADGGFANLGSSSSGLGLGAGGQTSAVKRMMAKMGWKEGQGLGKQEQGMTVPLFAKKTDRRSGVIVDESKHRSVNIDTQPTSVLLLRNMISPGEVDDELEDEVASECSKYGTVLRVLIFEITQANFPADEAVRIFVLFERTEESTKALVNLDKRFFGGRMVHATFFDEERFRRNELAPMPGEVSGFD